MAKLPPKAPQEKTKRYKITRPCVAGNKPRKVDAVVSLPEREGKVLVKIGKAKEHTAGRGKGGD